MQETPLISVVVPLYNEGPQVYRVSATICTQLALITSRYELIFVDDGSCDETWQQLTRLVAHEQHIKAFRLSRNFGKEAALSAGLAQSRGQAVITMDGDLQHPPEILGQMVARWQQGDVDIVEAVKAKANRGSMFKEWCARLFYNLHSQFTGMRLDGASDFKLMDRRVVDAINHLEESHLFFRGICQWLGYRRTSIPFEVAQRVGGETKWPFSKLFKLGMTGITSFSSAPLHLTTLIGMLFLLFSSVLGAHSLYMKITGQAVSGFTTVILLLLIVGSCILISLGVIGIYIAHIFEEVKNRPRYLISDYQVPTANHGLPSQDSTHESTA